MGTYAFDFINETGAIGSVALGQFPTDTDALRGAHNALTASFTAVALDVWYEGRRIVRLTRAHPGGKDVVERNDEPSTLWNVPKSGASDQRVL